MNIDYNMSMKEEREQKESADSMKDIMEHEFDVRGPDPRDSETYHGTGGIKLVWFLAGFTVGSLAMLFVLLVWDKL